VTTLVPGVAAEIAATPGECAYNLRLPMAPRVLVGAMTLLLALPAAVEARSSRGGKVKL
jgi:hypothetical protein